jgi:uncharacterized protein (DUF488 family)
LPPGDSFVWRQRPAPVKIGDMSQIPIYTIGYGSREIAAFIATLQRYEIGYLLDVRSRPYSRYKPDFSRQELEQHLKPHAIRYVFMGDALGGQPEDPACYNSDGKVDYDQVGRQAFFRQGIGRLQEVFQKQLRVAIMCSEEKPEQCHRSKLIGVALNAAGIPISHIDENDLLAGQEEVLLRLNKGQPSLFGDDFQQFTSRKKY